MISDVSLQQFKELKSSWKMFLTGSLSQTDFKGTRLHILKTMYVFSPIKKIYICLTAHILILFLYLSGLRKAEVASIENDSDSATELSLFLLPAVTLLS